jgi:predicted dehydrogenase
MKKARTRVVGVAFAGCGHVADAYVRQLRGHPGLKLLGVASRSADRARQFAAAHDLHAYASVEEMLADPRVDLVVNLTLHTVHARVTAQCLRAGKHVYSEKPLAMDRAAARRLVALARRRGLRLGCAPSTFLGETHQTAARLVRRGRIGPVRVIYAEVNHGRIERYHPAPEPFFAVGPMWDVGVYPITAITAVFGPVASVRAWGGVVLPRREAKGGRAFRITSPDFIVAWLELASGPVVRLTANFYVDRDRSKGGGSVELHGDHGRIWIGDFQLFDAPVEQSTGREPYVRVAPVRPPFAGVDFGRGVCEMVDAIRAGRPHRATGEQAAHVVEVVAAIGRSLDADGGRVRVRSRFPLPAPMPWAR